jgi:TonB family protein
MLLRRSGRLKKISRYQVRAIPRGLGTAVRRNGLRDGTAMKRLSLAVAMLGWSSAIFAQTSPNAPNDTPPRHLPGSTIAACRTSFPPMVFKQGEHPETTLTFMIGTDGGVKNVVVAKPSSYDLLDSAAVACVSTWRYMAATKNGQAIETPQTLTIPWTTAGQF